MLLKNSIIFLFEKFGYIKNNSYLCDVNNNLKHNDMATKKIIGFIIVHKNLRNFNKILYIF